MNEPTKLRPTNHDLARQVPGWLAVMILSPLVAMAFALWLDDSSQGPPAARLIGLALSVLGSAAGAMLAKGSARTRLLRGIGGAAVGLGGFALAYLLAIAITILANGL